MEVVHALCTPPMNLIPPPTEMNNIKNNVSCMCVYMTTPPSSNWTTAYTSDITQTPLLHTHIASIHIYMYTPTAGLVGTDSHFFSVN